MDKEICKRTRDNTMVLMIKRIIEKETREIDVYELRYNERNLELFERY